MDRFYTTLQLFFASVLTAVPWSLIGSVLLATFAVLFLVTTLYFLFKLLLTQRILRSPYQLLEIKPLRETEQSALATQQLFSLFHSIGQHRTWLMRLFSVSHTLSFEIVSTKATGIRYLVRVPAHLSSTIKNSLLSYLPGVKVTATTDYLPTVIASHVTELKLANHFAFPLKHHELLEKNDPIAYLTGNMTQLAEDELIAFQLVTAPTRSSAISEVSRITRLIYGKRDLLQSIHSRSPLASLFSITLKLVLEILLLPVGLLVFIFTGGKEGPLLPLSGYQRTEASINPYQTELEIVMKAKLDQPLFRTSVRVLSSSSNLSHAKKRQRGFVSALTAMSRTSYQSLIRNPLLRFAFLQPLLLTWYHQRRITPTSSLILSAAELGDLYHVPFTRTTKTEDMQKQFSKELPAPLSLKQTAQLDIVFAQNTYGNTVTPIGLTQDERRRHMYILGATGTGKSTMLVSMIHADMQNGKGLALVDPHGDLIEQVLQLVPEERIDDVVYFNPDDTGYPIGINLLERTPNLSPEAAIREKEFIAESIISLFHKIYSDKYSGPRMEYILRNTIHTAFTVPNATLFTVYKLLINTPFRKSVVKLLTDDNLRDFWKYEFAKAGDYQKVKMISPITNKIGRFLFSPTAKRILEQPKSTISFDQIINEGKILLCNVSKGKLGEDNSEVFGVVIMAKLQLAALKRARMPADERKDFYLYVDEFQNFATPAFAQILSEARKYRLAAILAHQTTSQLEDQSLVNITLANTGTVICFRTANPEDERMILPQFRPYIEQGEIASLPSYRFYMRLGALNPAEPFSGITIPVELSGTHQRAREVIKSSRTLYAKKYVPRVKTDYVAKPIPQADTMVKSSSSYLP